MRTLEIMDTTLRDGEQTSEVSYTPEEKLHIAQLLLNDLKVDRIEVASARVSDGEMDSVIKIAHWAKQNNCLECVEVLTFVDQGASIDWLLKTGVKTQNLLTKGSLNHLTHQLKKSAEAHFFEIKECIKEAAEKGISTNVYLEDWSNGMRNSRDYVFALIEHLQSLEIKRVMLPDTLGVLSPWESFSFLKEIIDRYPELHFDFHAHNDYDLAVANVMEGVRAGVHGIHLTINGMGERAGNAPLSSCVASLKDFYPDLNFKVAENAIYRVSKLVETFSGVRIPANKPVIGDNVFTQTAGIHADGDNKKNLYFNDLMPERFGREREYALGKTSGKANIQKNLESLGIQLDEEQVKLVTKKVIELGDKKEVVTKEDLPYIIADVLNKNPSEQRIKIETYNLSHALGLRPTATLKISIDGTEYEAAQSGDGQYDAFMNALKVIFEKVGKELPKLSDYLVRIPPGGNTDALCETIITWVWKGGNLKTRGLDSDQTVAAIKATEKMLNLIETEEYAV